MSHFFATPQTVKLTHWKRLWCWEGLGAGGKGDDGGWDGWMASLTRWTWVWVNSGSWWWTGRPGVLRFMGSQRVGQTEWLNWTELRLQPTRLLCPWVFPGKNPGVGCHFLLQRIFLTQGSNLGLLQLQADSLPLSHQGNTIKHAFFCLMKCSHPCLLWSLAYSMLSVL